MRLLHPDLIQEYYDSIKESYPNLTLQQCNEICSTPFIEVRKAIESGEFPTVRLKFFGTFTVYPKRIFYYLKLYNKMFKEQKMTPYNYFKKKEQLEKFLNKQDESKNNF